MSKIVVTGGCGYLGSHTIVDLIEQGYEVVSIDNYINSYADVLHGIRKITGQQVVNYEIDLTDRQATLDVMREVGDVSAIIHFAALKSVAESVAKPLKYFRNNLMSLFNLCEAAKDFEIKKLIFSSSCTVYGEPESLPVTEEMPFGLAESPYGRTKQMSEYILQDVHRAIPGLNIISLRYFNPAGAHDSGYIGESSRVKAVNLIPVITETAIGKRESCVVYGDDYPTRDGSCIRDYIHVMDLAKAHTLALKHIEKHANSGFFDQFNLGIGEGVTVLEAIKAFEKVTQSKLNYSTGPRRPGDIVSIYSNYEKARQVLGWRPVNNIEDIMKTAWKWEKERMY